MAELFLKITQPFFYSALLGSIEHERVQFGLCLTSSGFHFLQSLLSRP